MCLKASTALGLVSCCIIASGHAPSCAVFSVHMHGTFLSNGLINTCILFCVACTILPISFYFKGVLVLTVWDFAKAVT